MKTFDEGLSAEEKESMLESGKKIIPGITNDSDVNFIGIDDTFNFECQRCGSCCMHRDDIILNSYDVYRGAKAMGCTPNEFLQKYCTQTLGGFSKLPMVILGHKENGMCHFLQFDYMNGGLFKCIINDSKPGACANHPIGLITRYDCKKDEDNLEQAFIKVEQCENSKRPVPQKVRDWVKGYLDNKEEVDTAHEFLKMYSAHGNFRKWFFMTVFCQKLAEDNAVNQEDMVIKAFSMSCDAIIHYTYGNYDTSKPYIEQARDNMEKLNSFLENNDKIISEVENSLNKIFSEKNLTVDQIIADNDKGENGPKYDIGQLAATLASNVVFEQNQ